MTTKKSLIAQLQKKYPSMNIFEDCNGWVYNDDTVFIIDAETPVFASDGYDLLNYWTQNHEHWDMGIHNELVNFLNEHGWYAEWVNPGVVAIIKD